MGMAGDETPLKWAARIGLQSIGGGSVKPLAGPEKDSVGNDHNGQ
jgi:hypothetical protein